MRIVFILSLLLCSVARGDFPELFNTEPDPQSTLMSPQEAADKMKLPAGFKAAVFAAEPDVQNPIAMSWDARGRLWIAENYTYAERGQRFQLDLRDRVVILDNTSGDSFDKRIVFTDQVQMLTGLEVAADGVYLMCPPQLLFIPDRDHDDVPDGPGEVVLDGFTVANQNYHNFANGLRFGPDGWLYGRCGGSCPGRIGVPGTPADRRLALEGGMWRYHPTRKTVEVLTTGTTNPWGHDWNEVGEAFFVNTVNGHLWHLIPGAHFTRPFTLDPNRRTYELIDFHADHWHFDTGQSWTKSRDGVANSYGGGHAHSGTMIYQGLTWPEKYRGKLFTLNFHGRRANQETLQRRGSGYVATHEDDFFIAGDNWFRGMELSCGPDGSVFVLDWSDSGECHEHTGVHRTSGRIFKITHNDSRGGARIPFDMRAWGTNNLASVHKTGANWHLQQARLALRSQQQDGRNMDAAARQLRELFNKSSQNDARLVQSLLTLYVIGAADKGFLREQLNHASEHVRAWAVRLLTDTWPIDDALGPVWLSDDEAVRIQTESKSLLGDFKQMALADSSALVRLALASTLQRLPLEHRSELAAALVTRVEDADDHNLPLMIWYGLIPVADGHAQDLVAVTEVCRLPKTSRLISRCLAEQIEKQPAAFDRLLNVVVNSDDVSFQKTVLTGISDGLRGWHRATEPQSWQAVTKIKSPELESLIRELSVVFGDGRALAEIKAIALDESAEPAMRLSALQTLIQSKPDDLRETCESLLKDSRLNVIAARGLSASDDPAVARALVERYRNFRGTDKPKIMSMLASRRSFANVMLTAIRDGKIPRADLSAYQVRQIHSLGDDELSGLVGDVWGEVRETPEAKQQIISQLKDTLTPDALASADKSLGRQLFEKSCQNCHRLYGVGGKVGPDLTGANRGNLDYLLSNIIDPSGVVDKDYRMTILLLDDDRVINGLVTSETERTIAVQTATEALTFDKESIQGRKITEQSPMPEGMLDNLSAEQIQNLIGYLAHPSQVALP